MEAEKTLTNEEIIRELLDLLKKNTMKEQANDVFEICTYVDGLEKKIVSMTEELTSMQDQIKKMQEDTLINNAKKALTEAQERLNARCEQIKSQVSEIKVQVKSTAKNIVDETKAKGRAALYRVTEFVGIKKRLLNVRTAVKDMIVSTDRDIARIALLAKGLREAGQIVNNAFHTFADKPEVDYSQKERIVYGLTSFTESLCKKCCPCNIPVRRYNRIFYCCSYIKKSFLHSCKFCHPVKCRPSLCLCFIDNALGSRFYLYLYLIYL